MKSKHAGWFLLIGLISCTQALAAPAQAPQGLWEAYEQARHAIEATELVQSTYLAGLITISATASPWTVPERRRGGIDPVTRFSYGSRSLSSL